jgi:hypothetical protein
VAGLGLARLLSCLVYILKCCHRCLLTEGRPRLSGAPRARRGDASGSKPARPQKSRGMPHDCWCWCAGRWKGARVAVKIVEHSESVNPSLESLRETMVSPNIQHPNVVSPAVHTFAHQYAHCNTGMS